MRPSWDSYFSGIAKLVAQRSTCNTSKVGAVIVRDNTILSTGYNGSLSGEKNCCDTDVCIAKTKPGKKYDNCPAVHAEANAVAQAAINGVSIKDAEIYVTKKPCLICAKLLAAAGVCVVIVVNKDELYSNEVIGVRDLVKSYFEEDK